MAILLNMTLFIIEQQLGYLMEINQETLRAHKN
jgi:hypothetical protein